MYALTRSGRERRVRREASAWAVRLAMTVLDARQERRLARWLAAHPAHGPALADAEMTWALAGECVPARTVPRASVWRRMINAALPRGPLAWSTGAACAAVLIALRVAGPDGYAAVRTADYRSAPGEVRSIGLSDGSKVMLGSDSALDVHYDHDERRVRLLRGEAIFTPAARTAAEPRNFVVAAAGGSSTALGTRYIVKRENDEQVWVGVLQHSVEVGLDRAPLEGQGRLTLEAGRSAVYSHAQGVQRSDRNPARESDWAEGVLVFDGMPLVQVLDRLAAFRTGSFLLVNRGVAQTPVNGLFHIDNIDGALATLGAELHLKLVQLPGLTVLY